MSSMLIKDAASFDRIDPLSSLRDAFHMPVCEGREDIYFTGHSLGLQPKSTETYVMRELHKWQNLAIKGHFTSDHPWMPYHEFVTPMLAELVGAKHDEVVAMNSLTTNMHLMLVSFYRPTKQRYKILVESKIFPSDHYAMVSQLRYHGFDPEDALLIAEPRPGEHTLRTEDIAALLATHGEQIALISFPGVQYFTGQAFDLAAITALGHQYGCTVGFDLAHAVGNVPLALHEWNVDFAFWCSYKYLNAGPGAIGGCFVHQRHGHDKDLPRFAGWWGHDKTTRFTMPAQFQPIPGAEGWQLSNPPILQLAALRASLEIFEQAGGIKPLREKSLQLTGYLAHQLIETLGDRICMITPQNPTQRGCQLSLAIDLTPGQGKQLIAELHDHGVSSDWREPNVLRIAPVPLYNRFREAEQFVNILRDCLQSL